MERRDRRPLEEGELLTSPSDARQLPVHVPVTEVGPSLAAASCFDQVGRVEVIGGESNNETGTLAFRATLPSR